jgi:hypothetical protein
MTENIASNPAPEPMENSHPSHAHRQEIGSAPVNAAAEGWEAVNFPGQLPVAEQPLSVDDHPPLIENQVESSASNQQGNNTNELLQLIQDLNQCNDVLLGRVSELEEALEKSQVALQTEVERSQSGEVGLALPPDQQPEYVQRQVAHLLSELDVANDGLRRTTIHNETLQAELEASQQRVAQLERECTLLQQRFSEKNTAFHQAEDSCRDLKARLYRQQRYTLQFKVALEKCLTMASETGSSHESIGGRSPTLTATATQPVSMPKTPQIQPWSMQQQDLAPDPALEHLLRNLQPTVQEQQGAKLPMSDAMVKDMPGMTDSQSDNVVDSEAESLLWHDLERVIESPVEVPSRERDGVAQAAAMESAPVSPEAGEQPATPVELGFTEPSPWGIPLATPDEASRQSEVEPVPSAAAPQPDPAGAAAEVAPVSPAYVHDQSVSSGANPQSSPGLPPYLKSAGQASPSPLVYPLRPQKKIKSLAAVQLPSFGNSVRRG